MGGEGLEEGKPAWGQSGRGEGGFRGCKGCRGGRGLKGCRGDKSYLPDGSRVEVVEVVKYLFS